VDLYAGKRRPPMNRRTVIVTRAELLDDAAFEALVARVKTELVSDPEPTEVEFALAADDRGETSDDRWLAR
jgi:hypothetical protein